LAAIKRELEGEGATDTFDTLLPQSPPDEANQYEIIDCELRDIDLLDIVFREQDPREYILKLCNAATVPARYPDDQNVIDWIHGIKKMNEE